MGDGKVIVPIVLSLLIATVGSYFIYKWVQKGAAPREKTVTVRTEAFPVAVAKVDIPAGSKIEKEAVDTTPFFEESLPPGYHSSSLELEGRVAIASIKKGEPIVEHRLAPKDVTTGGVSAVVKKGGRAVAVKGGKIVGVGGFVKPGDRVDVLVTMRDPATDTLKTKIVLQSIRVIASGDQTEGDGKGDPGAVDVYTLEVTPEESEKLALAAAEGEIRFALRNTLDAEWISTGGTTISKTFGEEPPVKRVVVEKIVEKKVVVPAKVARKRPPRRSMTVEIIKGSEVTQKSFNM